jgi:integrase
MQEGAPKPAAGVRDVALPPFLADELRDHMKEYAGPGPEGLVCRGEQGAMLRRSNFGRAVKWPNTVTKARLPAGFHFHDLRHTGNPLAANAGATTRDRLADDQAARRAQRGGLQADHLGVGGQ